MACACNNNFLRSYVKTVEVDTGNTFLLLTPDTALSPVNEQRVSIKVTASVPPSGMNKPVYVVLNDTPVQIFDKFGNIFYGSNIRTNVAIHGYFGINGSGGANHFQLTNFPFGRAC